MGHSSTLWQWKLVGYKNERQNKKKLGAVHQERPAITASHSSTLIHDISSGQPILMDNSVRMKYTKLLLISSQLLQTVSEDGNKPAAKFSGIDCQKETYLDKLSLLRNTFR